MKTQPKPRVSLGFSRERIPVLIAFCGNVVTQMTAASQQFATPSPALSDVTTATNKLDVANQAALDGGRQAIIDRNAAKAELLSLMRQLAAYVQNQCQNDLSILISSGFDAVRVPAPIGPLPAPGTPTVLQGPVSGSIVARTGKVYGASAYNWRVALVSAPTVYVQTAQKTAARHTFEGLAIGEVYKVEVNALGAAGESDWTSGTSKMVI